MSLYDYEVSETLDRVIDQIPPKSDTLKYELYKLAQYIDLRKDYMVQLEGQVESLKSVVASLVSELESADLVIDDLDDSIIRAAREYAKR